MKQTQKSFSFNLFDLFVLLLLAALAVFAVIYFSPQKKESSPATVTLTLSGVRREFSELLHEGDLVYDANGITKLGTILHIERTTDTLSIKDPLTGTTRSIPYPDNSVYLLQITLSATDAAPAEHGCTIGNISIIPEESLPLRTSLFSGTAICKSIIFGGAL